MGNIFGKHIIADLAGCEFEALNNRARIVKFVEEIVTIAGMEKLSPITVYKAEPVTEKDQGGWTGFCVVSESHASIHTFPFRRFLAFDMFSCKDELNVYGILNYLEDAFSPSDMIHKVIERGPNFPPEHIPAP